MLLRYIHGMDMGMAMDDAEPVTSKDVSGDVSRDVPREGPSSTTGVNHFSMEH